MFEQEVTSLLVSGLQGALVEIAILRLRQGLERTRFASSACWFLPALALTCMLLLRGCGYENAQQANACWAFSRLKPTTRVSGGQAREGDLDEGDSDEGGYGHP